MQQNIPPYILEFDREMQAFEQDIASLRAMLEMLENIQKRSEKLERYYSNGQWLKDFENYPDAMVGILSEDGLYNLFFEEQEARKAILKHLVERL